MKKLLLVVSLCAAPSMGFGEDNTGHWTGTGFQDGDTWEMEVQIVQDGARVDYPDIPCGGIWLFESASAQSRGREWLTYGQELCIDGLNVAVRTEGKNAILVEWIDEGGVVIATAPLQRAGIGSKSGRKDKAQK